MVKKNFLLNPGQKIAGLVLAGGQSRRMGTDKAFIRPWGKERLLDMAFGLLASVVEPCYVSCARGRPRAGFPCLEDMYGNVGPAGGIATGLAWCASHLLHGMLVIACDLPCMKREILEWLLVAHHNSRAKVTLYARADGRLEMLAAVYAIEALPVIISALNQGEHSLQRMLRGEDIQLLPLRASWEKFFLNCNSAVEMEQLRQIFPEGN